LKLVSHFKLSLERGSDPYMMPLF